MADRSQDKAKGTLEAKIAASKSRTPTPHSEKKPSAKPSKKSTRKPAESVPTSPTTKKAIRKKQSQSTESMTELDDLPSDPLATILPRSRRQRVSSTPVRSKQTPITIADNGDSSQSESSEPEPDYGQQEKGTAIDESDSEDKDLADIEVEEAEKSAKKTTKPRALSKGSSASPELPVETSADMKHKFDIFQEVCRKHFLRHFNFDPYGPLIRSVFGDEVKKTDVVWQMCVERFRWHNNNWRNRSIEHMMEKIEGYKEEENEKGTNFSRCQDMQTLTLFFEKKYSASAFAWVFEFVNPSIDVIESDRNPHWRYFFKTIWCNFGARVKKTMDWSSRPDHPEISPWSRANLRKWFHVMADSEHFRRADIEKLVLMESRVPRVSRGDKSVPTKPDQDADYFFPGQPPPTTPSKKRSAPLSSKSLKSSKKIRNTQ